MMGKAGDKLNFEGKRCNAQSITLHYNHSQICLLLTQTYQGMNDKELLQKKREEGEKAPRVTNDRGRKYNKQWERSRMRRHGYEQGREAEKASLKGHSGKTTTNRHAKENFLAKEQEDHNIEDRER